MEAGLKCKRAWLGDNSLGRWYLSKIQKRRGSKLCRYKIKAGGGGGIPGRSNNERHTNELMFLDWKKQKQNRKWVLRDKGTRGFGVEVRMLQLIVKSLVSTQTNMGRHWQVSAVNWRMWVTYNRITLFTVETVWGSGEWRRENGGPEGPVWRLSSQFQWLMMI